MTMEYKGYTLNTNGDNNWGNKELNVHKKLIDANIKLDTKVDASEAFVNSVKTSVQNGYSYKFVVTGGVYTTMLQSMPVYCEYRVIVRPYPTDNNSMYMITCTNNYNNNFTFVEKVKKGTYIANSPIIDCGGITTVEDAELEIIVTQSILY